MAETKPTEKSDPDIRRSRRAAIKARARFREAGANPYEVEIDDLSATGFRMISYTRPRTGTHIWVTLPGLQSLEAIVRRSEGNNHGCEFTLPLHPSVAAHMQSLLRPQKPE
ncbi:MAG: PilZ domain-containing protein [Sphingopyxis sp.]|nr:PilZ domain-containing protein [Sphingopyxis sp.]